MLIFDFYNRWRHRKSGCCLLDYGDGETIEFKGVLFILLT